MSGRDEQGAKVSAGGNCKRIEFIKFNDDEFKYLVEGDDEMSLMGGTLGDIVIQIDKNADGKIEVQAETSFELREDVILLCIV